MPNSRKRDLQKGKKYLCKKELNFFARKSESKQKIHLDMRVIEQSPLLLLIFPPLLSLSLMPALST